MRIIIFLVVLAFARYYMHREYNKLDNDYRAYMNDNFSGGRLVFISYMPLVIIVSGIISVRFFNLSYGLLISVAGILLILIYVSSIQLFMLKRIIDLRFPRIFIRKFIFVRLVVLLTIILLLIF